VCLRSTVSILQPAFPCTCSLTTDDRNASGGDGLVGSSERSAGGGTRCTRAAGTSPHRAPTHSGSTPKIQSQTFTRPPTGLVLSDERPSSPPARPAAARQFAAQAILTACSQAEDEENEDLFAEYQPRHYKEGQPHPDAVVETTSLSFAELPAISYKLHLPAAIYQPKTKTNPLGGALSRAQLETVSYGCQARSHPPAMRLRRTPPSRAPEISAAPVTIPANAAAAITPAMLALQKHETILDSGQRAGFFLGDGVGLGKGRQLAGIIYENWLRGRKRHLCAPHFGHRVALGRSLLTLRMHVCRPLLNISPLNTPTLPTRGPRRLATSVQMVSALGCTGGSQSPLTSASTQSVISRTLGRAACKLKTSPSCRTPRLL
jgi:hypothetical protein